MPERTPEAGSEDDAELATDGAELPPEQASREVVVPDALDGARLDKAAALLLEGVSRARVRAAIDAGAVRVNGRGRPKGSVVAKGDVLTIAADLDAGEIAAEPTPGAPLHVLHVSADVIVVDKPAGQPTAPLRPRETGTLANALLGRFPELAGIGYSAREPGLLHRLDTDTSGLVVVARNAGAFTLLRESLKADRVRKGYLLVCSSEGLPETGTITIPLAPHPKDQRRVLACVHPRDVMRYAPRPATTRYAVERRVGAYALVRAEVTRALRHQIRAHFAAISHPLVGDALYGGSTDPRIERHALHADHVAHSGPPGLTFDVTSPLPRDMAHLFDPS